MAGLLTRFPFRLPSHPDMPEQWTTITEKVTETHSSGSVPDSHRIPFSSGYRQLIVGPEPRRRKSTVNISFKKIILQNNHGKTDIAQQIVSPLPKRHLLDVYLHSLHSEIPLWIHWGRSFFKISVM